MALKELKQAVEAAGESCSRLELDTAVLDLKELELKVAAMKSMNFLARLGLTFS
jgi:hypothetical protein